MEEDKANEKARINDNYEPYTEEKKLWGNEKSDNNGENKIRAKQDPSHRSLQLKNQMVLCKQDISD